MGYATGWTFTRRKMRRLIGNWKMQGTLELCKAFISGIEKQNNLEITICPPSLYAQYLVNASKNFSVGVQDISNLMEGPHTGEISLEMLEDLKLHYAIIGHSERQEAKELVLSKLQRILPSKVTPLLCLASLELYEFFLPYFTSKVILAYEPPSAIGTGLLPDLQELKEKIAIMKGSGCQVLYGGSVKEDNLEELFLTSKVDGFLVGGASLKLDSFNKMANLLSRLN